MRTIQLCASAFNKNNEQIEKEVMERVEEI